MNPQDRIADQVRRVPRSGIRDFFELVIGRDDVISLGVGEPDFSAPWHVREAAIYSLEKGMTSYTSNLGLLSLREEIARYVKGHFGVEYDPESEIIITVGVSEGLDIACRLYRRRAHLLGQIGGMRHLRPPAPDLPSARAAPSTKQRRGGGTTLARPGEVTRGKSPPPDPLALRIFTLVEVAQT